MFYPAPWSLNLTNLHKPVSKSQYKDNWKWQKLVQNNQYNICISYIILLMKVHDGGKTAGKISRGKIYNSPFRRLPM